MKALQSLKKRRPHATSRQGLKKIINLISVSERDRKSPTALTFLSGQILTAKIYYSSRAMKMPALVVWSSLHISGAELVRKKTTLATGIIFSAILT